VAAVSKIKRYLDVAGNWLLIATIVGFLAYSGWVMASPSDPAPPPRDIYAAAQIPEAEKRWIEQRHKFHGIYASVIENGEYYFI
jgi:hypothetical protein